MDDIQVYIDNLRRTNEDNEDNRDKTGINALIDFINNPIESSLRNFDMHERPSTTNYLLADDPPIDNDYYPRVTEILSRKRAKRKRTKLKPKIVSRTLPSFRFGRSFLMDFSDSGEILVYLDRNLYILGKKNPKLKGIVYQGDSYKLEVLEDIFELEQYLIESNYDNIKKFQKESLLFYSENKNSERLMNNFDSGNLESFIVNCLIPLHTGKQTNKKHSKKNNRKLKQNKLEEPRLSYGVSILERLVDDISIGVKSLEGFSLMNGGIYLLQKGFFRTLFNSSRNLDKVRYYQSVEEFETRYLDRLSKALEETIKKDILSYIRGSEDTPGIIRNATKKIPSKAGELKFDKNSSRECIVYKESGEYIVKSRKKYYHFPSTRVGVTLSLVGGRVTFSDRPFIYNDPGYRHPFVPPGPSKIKSICLGIGNNQAYRNENWGINSQDTSDNKTANEILDVLRRAKNVLTCGSTNGNTNATYTTLSKSSGINISARQAKLLESKGIEIFHGKKYGK